MTQKALSHFGIPGMHWGVRRSVTTTKPSRSEKAKKIPLTPEQMRVKQKKGQLVGAGILGSLGGFVVGKYLTGNTDLALVSGAAFLVPILTSSVGASLAMNLVDTDN